MPKFDNWIGNDRADNYLRATRAWNLAATTWRRIKDKPSTIVIFREGIGQLDPQTVRLENSNYGNIVEQMSVGLEVGDQDMHILGLKDHRSLPDLDIQRGDIFIHDDKQFEITNTITTNIGWIQAYAEAKSS